jgi:hypothetical protein
MGTEYLWALARVTVVAIATVPAVAAFMNLRRSTSASSCAPLGSNLVCDYIISFRIGAKSQTGQSAAYGRPNHYWREQIRAVSAVRRREERRWDEASHCADTLLIQPVVLSRGT